MQSEIRVALNSVNAIYADEANRDISNALSEFLDLYVNTDSYVFHDGSSCKTVTLSGTIPVSYKGNTYHIPICLYLLDNHPYKAPICYVRPTNEMMIKSGNHVDSSGKIDLPYLRDWHYPDSDLHGLFQVLSIVFGDQCPVFSKQQPASVERTVAGSSSLSLPPPPPFSSSTSSSTLPPCDGLNQAITSVPARPVPPYSAYFTTPAAASSTTPTTVFKNSYPGTGDFVANQTRFSSGPRTTSATASAAAPSIVGHHPENVHTNLLAAVEEKLRGRLSSSIGTLHAEFQAVRETWDHLNAGQRKLKGLLGKMSEEQQSLDSSLASLKRTIHDMDGVLSMAGGSGSGEIDEAVDATTPLFRQLLNGCAEDGALEDTIYFLGEGLKRGKIDLETYLKHVRRLSRQQFMLRATLQRCRQVAGLST